MPSPSSIRLQACYLGARIDTRDMEKRDSVLLAPLMLRAGNPEWPHGWELLNVPLATLNTMVLITSSVTMVMSWASLAMSCTSPWVRSCSAVTPAGSV